MPLPPALAARLAKRGIISKKTAQNQTCKFEFHEKFTIFSLNKRFFFIIFQPNQRKKYLPKVTMIKKTIQNLSRKILSPIPKP